MREPVMLESPYRGRNRWQRLLFERYRDLCVRDSVLEHDEAPFASHRMYPGPLDEDVPEEREAGIYCGYAWWTVARKVVFYVDFGLSPGMESAVKRADAAGKEIVYRRLFHAVQ